MSYKWIAGAGQLVGLALFMTATPVLAEVSVESSSAGWHVVADQEPMTRVLAALSKQTGIKISGTRKLITDPNVSGTFDGDLETVLSRILRGVDYATETVTDSNGKSQVARLIVLSGEIGQDPTPRAVRTARRIPHQPTAVEVAQAKEDGARVTGLLETKARVAAGLPGTNPAVEPDADAARGGSGITRNEDGTFDIDPATQARMAEATRRAQADLQALVNALRQNEDGGN